MSGVDERFDKLASRRAYDRLSGVYDLLADASERESREAGLAALALAPGERALEIGFGTGHALVALARAVGPTGSVAGIDLSSGMLEVTKRRLADEGLIDRIRLDLGDARTLPYPDAAFDVAFSSFTLELFGESDAASVLSEIRRTLTREGRLGIVSLDDIEGRHLAISAYKWLHRHFPHFIDCEPIDVSGRLSQAGFEIRQEIQKTLWGLAVKIVVAVPG